MSWSNGGPDVDGAADMIAFAVALLSVLVALSWGLVTSTRVVSVSRTSIASPPSSRILRLWLSSRFDFDSMFLLPSLVRERQLPAGVRDKTSGGV